MRIALALQGGGAHGAYTWGVLDRLLDEADLEITDISGASAGAVNAVALLDGIRRGSRKKAQDALATIWEAIGAHHPAGPWLGLFPPAEYQHAMLKQMLAWTQWLTPERFNPLDIHPLRDILDTHIDFARLRRAPGPGLFIAATDVHARRARVFTRSECALEVLLASTCLPQVHHGVVLDATLYWDGGFTANPPLWPLVRAHNSSVLVLVRLTPARTHGALDSVDAIRAQVTELSFDAPLSAELDSIGHARAMALASPFALSRAERHLRRLKIEVITAPDWMTDLDPISRADPQPKFLHDLFSAGRASADTWLRTYVR